VHTAEPLREEAEFRLLTSFIFGMRGEAGHELRIRIPDTLDQALSIATVVYNAKKMEQRHKDYDTFTVKTRERNTTDSKEYGPPRRRNGQQWRSSVRRPQERVDKSKD
jgi:hypothetical protein